MFRKIAVIITTFFLCLGLDNCKSPEEPEPYYEYRYNVEVIFTRVAVDYPGPPWLVLVYRLQDPAVEAVGWDPWWDGLDIGSIRMYPIGENKYRCYLSKVFVQTPLFPTKHKVSVADMPGRIQRAPNAENFDIQGAYEQEIENQEIENADYGTSINSSLYFKMSKE